uniref:RRM domain-containing protein n=1 Tax=Strigamia maritima TaxID=126957 RepID=T1J9Y8_STRMM
MTTMRVFMGGLNQEVCEHDIRDLFKGYGIIQQVVLKRGFGFVQFDNQIDADDAVHDLNGKSLFGQRVHLEFARLRPQCDTKWGCDERSRNFNLKYDSAPKEKFRLKVENISSIVSRQELTNYMKQGGHVTYVHKPNEKEGVVEYASRADMERAIVKLNNTVFNGCRLKLIEDTSHQNYDSRSRTRSKNYSRSKSSFSSRSPLNSRRSRSRSPLNSRRSRSRSPLNSRRSRSRSPLNSRRSRSKSPLIPRSQKSSRSKPEKSDVTFSLVNRSDNKLVDRLPVIFSEITSDEKLRESSDDTNNKLQLVDGAINDKLPVKKLE